MRGRGGNANEKPKESQEETAEWRLRLLTRILHILTLVENATIDK